MQWGTRTSNAEDRFAVVIVKAELVTFLANIFGFFVFKRFQYH